MELDPDVVNLWLLFQLSLIPFVKKDAVSAPWCPRCVRGKFMNTARGVWSLLVHAFVLLLVYFIMTNFDSKGIPGHRQKDPEDVVKFSVTLRAEWHGLAERMIGARCTAFSVGSAKEQQSMQHVCAAGFPATAADLYSLMDNGAYCGCCASMSVANGASTFVCR